MELASRDVRQFPLLLPEPQPHECPEVDQHLEEVRHHLHEERCLICLRWYRNARRAYLTQWKGRLRPFERKPRLHSAVKGHQEYILGARANGVGLGRLEGRLLWEQEKRNLKWKLTVQFRPGATKPAEDLRTYDAMKLHMTLHRPKNEKLIEVVTSLGLRGKEGLSSSTEIVHLDCPQRIRRVTVRPYAPLGSLEMQ
jgi:hypothetical protein